MERTPLTGVGRVRRQLVLLVERAGAADDALEIIVRFDVLTFMYFNVVTREMGLTSPGTGAVVIGTARGGSTRSRGMITSFWVARIFDLCWGNSDIYILVGHNTR
jgi:hypothetical protein